MKNLILIIGLPGSGKSTISKSIAMELDCPHLSTENIRATLLKVDKVQADCDFTQEEQDKVYKAITVKANEMLEQNNTVLVEGVFRSKIQRSLLLDNLPINTQVIKFLIFSDEQVVFKRLVERKKQGTVAPASVEGYKKIKKQFLFPSKDENYMIIDNTFNLKNSIETVLNNVRKFL